MVWKKRVFVILVFVIFLVKVEAVSFGVSPASYEIDFEPGLEQSFNFGFLFDDPDQDFEIVIEGELKEYVNVWRIPGTAAVTVDMRLPQEIEKPGVNRIKVGARPISSGEGSGARVGVVATVSGIILVHVPYPGKYAEASFKVHDANSGEKTSFVLKIFSKGEESIVASPRIEIFDSENNSVGVFDLGSELIEPADSVDMSSQLDVSSYGAGNYRAVATVEYTGQERPVVKEDEFRLGELFVDIVNYTREYNRDKINPIHIDIESGWNDPVSGVFASGNVRGYDIMFQTPSIDLKPWARGRLVGHFDTTAIEEEEFQMNLVLRYGDKITEKTIDVGFKKEEVNYLLWGGIALGVILVVGFVVWIIVKLKRLEGKRERGKKK